MSLPAGNLETCSWCAARIRPDEVGEYEFTKKRKGQRSFTRGYYVCIRCENWLDNLIQQKVQHTWMLLKARAEKSCCGGEG